MKRSVFLPFWFMIIIDVGCTERLGYIRNAAYISDDSEIIILYNNTCSECICNGFFSSVSPAYVGLNCYENNKTCELFANYSSSSLSMVTMSLDSTFIFTEQPPSQNQTAGNLILDSSIVLYIHTDKLCFT